MTTRVQKQWGHMKATLLMEIAYTLKWNSFGAGEIQI